MTDFSVKRSEGYRVSDKTWLASDHGLSAGQSGTLDATAFTPVNGYVLAGTAGTYDAATKTIKAAAGEVTHIVLEDIPVAASAATATGAFIVHGIVHGARVKGAGAATFANGFTVL